MTLGLTDSTQPIGARPLQAPARGIASPVASAQAIVFRGDRTANLSSLDLVQPEETDAVVAIEWSGVSTGTERLFWTGDMPPFPGFAYPLVPGYEAVGRVIAAPSRPDIEGKRVFVPGSKGFKDAHGLFGASASHLVVASDKLVPIDLKRPDEAVLLALAATAMHAVKGADLPDLVIGHGVLGRLAARIIIALGGTPVVWETNPDRIDSQAYRVIHPEDDARRDYSVICDMSGDAAIIDKALTVMARGGEIVLAGFYEARPAFTFPIAFMKEMRLRVAAEWTREDLDRVLDLIEAGSLSLDNLITHARPARDAEAAYETAFTDATCLKMILDWRDFE